MKTVTITSQGQITLPASVRKALNLRGSDKLQLGFNIQTREISLTKPMTLDELTQFSSKFVNNKLKKAPSRTRESYEEYVVEKWRSKDL